MYEGLAARAYDVLHAARGKDYAAEAAAVAAAVRQRRPHAHTLLDVACGSGLHLAALRGLGFDVAGVDRSPAMLALARGRLGPCIPLHEADMRDLDLGGRFDVVTCLFSSIGYLATPEELRAGCAALARHLHPGGVLVVEPWLSPGVWIDGHVAADSGTADGLAVARASRCYRRGRVSGIDMQWLIATSERVDHIVETHEMGLYEPVDYEDALAAAGLVDIELDPAGITGRGLWVATQPGAPPATG
jgi:SAM-dependent methyltransferase